MDACERIVLQMRKAGRHRGEPELQIGIVGKGGSIKAGDLELDAEDYLVDFNLRACSERCELKGSEDCKSRACCGSKLGEGDQVVLFKPKMKDDEDDEPEFFIVLAKVVEAK